MKGIRITWKNLTSKPLQLALSLILFALGVALISFLILVNSQVKDKFDRNQAGIDMVIGAKGSPLQSVLCNMFHIDSPTGNITLAEAKKYLNPKHPLIKRADPLSLGDSYRGYRIVGTNSNFKELYELEVREGKWIEKDFEVCIGAILADREGLNIGDTFYSSHGLTEADGLEHDHGTKFKVVGILEGSGTVADQLILCSPKTIWDVHNHDHGEEAHEDHEGHHHEEPRGMTNAEISSFEEESITSVLVQFKNKTSIAALNFPRAINENTGVMAVNPVYEINRFYGMMGVGFESLRIMAYVIVFVSGLSIFISLFNSLKERKYELSLLRVVGASPSNLFFIIIAEGLFIAVIGYVFGILISHFAMWFLASGMESSYKYSFSAMQFYMAELWLFFGAITLGFVAALIPAIKAYRTDIHKVLSER
jgi:putative ABC transport system permease protein